MNRTSFGSRCAAALLAGGLLAAAPAFADKPSSKGNKGKGESHSQERKEHKGSPQGGYFGDSHRQAVHGYYDQHFQQGKKCPPGLAKKHNGCMPPGQAKKWAVGKPLPRDVVYYDIPRPLAVQLGTPPAHHRYVRVASDILLIATGTGMVIDGLQDLGRM